jgi:hypothetical protein
MDNPNSYRGLNFSEQRHRVSRRVVGVVVAGAGFTLAWWIVPHAALYWLLLPIVGFLAWMASYGWHEANTHLIRFLESLEQA